MNSPSPFWNSVSETLADLLRPTYYREAPGWPDVSHYYNAERHHFYKPHNREEAAALVDNVRRYILSKGGEGSGKALALNTQLPTPSGWTTMGDVSIGDSLLDEQGQSCAVTATTDVMIGRPCFLVTFIDGSEIVADAEHLWRTFPERSRKSLSRRGQHYVNGRRAHLPCNQPRNGPEILTTAEIGKSLWSRKGVRNHVVPLAAPLDLPAASLSIDPYVLGYWLGDGRSNGAEVTIGKQDQDDAIPLIEACGETLVRRSVEIQFGITPSGRGRNMTSRAFRFRLESLGLIGRKHVPLIYLRSSVDQRLALLQGLMDSDGSIDGRGKAEFATTCRAIADGFQELAASLMIKTARHSKFMSINGTPYEVWRFFFTPYFPVFRLPRKAARVRPAGRHAVRQFRRAITSVTPVASVPVRCIQVDSPNHLYLAGRAMIPTHNSVFGIIKDLERFRRGCHGIVVSPDFEHFKRSLWPEFRRWCPWDMVHPKHRYRQAPEWEPTKPFMMSFVTGANGYFGGIDNEMGWEGPNVNFAHFDEARRKDTPLALKVLDGRVRIPGPLGDPPQMWLTTTPRKHWLFDYFGPRQPGGQTDTYAAFKRDSFVFTLITKENEENLEEDYAQKRRQSLTEAEARVLLEALWEDLDDTSHFLPSMLLWDLCKATIPPLDAYTPIIVSLDGAVTYDNFGITAVSRHWEPARYETDVAFRFVEAWTADQGPINFMGTEDYPGPERRLKWLLGNFNVVQVCFDAAQLHDMAQRLGVPGEGLAWFSEFSQASERLVADKRLLDLVIQRRLAHDGNASLRQHIDNADKKEDPQTRRLRIVKRHDALKIDLAVSGSMAAHRCLELNL